MGQGAGGVRGYEKHTRYSLPCYVNDDSLPSAGPRNILAFSIRLTTLAGILDDDEVVLFGDGKNLVILRPAGEPVDRQNCTPGPFSVLLS